MKQLSHQIIASCLIAPLLLTGPLLGDDKASGDKQPRINLPNVRGNDTGSRNSDGGQSILQRGASSSSSNNSGGASTQPRLQINRNSNDAGRSGNLPKLGSGSGGSSSQPRLPLNNPPNDSGRGINLPKIGSGNSGSTGRPGIQLGDPPVIRGQGSTLPGTDTKLPLSTNRPNFDSKSGTGSSSRGPGLLDNLNLPRNSQPNNNPGGNVGTRINDALKNYNVGPNLPNAGSGPGNRLNDSGRLNIGGNTSGRPNIGDGLSDSLGKRANTIRPRDATRPGDGLPNLQLDPARIKDRGPLLGDGLKGSNLNIPGADRRPNLGNVQDLTRRFEPNQSIIKAKVDRNGLLGDLARNPQLSDELNKLRGARNPQQLDQFFNRLQTDPVFQDSPLSKMNVPLLPGNFQKNVNQGVYQQLVQSNVGVNIHLGNQYNLYAAGGDVARQLNLNQVLIANGGWRNRYVGPVYPQFTTLAFSAWYPGPAFYPAYCWMPRWTPWVSWCFWDYCWPIYDPRPFWCRPIWFDPCPPIVVYEYPVFQPLPVVACGTWVEVPVTVVDSGFDLQLLAVRFVDPGHPDQQLGPRYRVWVRNNSAAAVGAPFNVTLVAANSPTLPASSAVQAGVSINSIDAHELTPVDIRLPFEANRLGQTADGHRIPFSHLHVLVDSHRDLAESNEQNNGTAILRGDVLPVDPAAFSTDVTAATPGAVISLAGEGFGPEPGQLIVMLNGQSLQAEIHGWYDLGVNFKLPEMNVGQATEAQVFVVRGDGAASNPVVVALAPSALLRDAPLPPLPMP